MQLAVLIRMLKKLPKAISAFREVRHIGETDSGREAMTDHNEIASEGKRFPRLEHTIQCIVVSVGCDR